MALRPLTLLLGLVLATSVLGDPPAAPPEPAKQPEPKPASTADKKPTTPTLKLGDKAPPLTGETWVQGEPISSFDDKHVYVVEFWATWCPSCREALPHLAKLARTHKNDLTILAIASSEKKEKL